MHQHSYQNGVEGKVCAHCRQWKPLTDYGQLKGQKDGLNYKCKACNNAGARVHKAKYPGDSTRFYHKHHEEELTRRKEKRASVNEKDILTDQEFQKRFFEKVKRGEPDECWEWQAYLMPRGYGEIGFRGALLYSHRVAFLLSGADIPDGLFVLHKCDNPPCCNPAHLFLGTNKDNMDDMIAKGRHWSPVGDKNWTAKLTWEQVAEIRKRYAQEDVQQKELAKQYGVKACTIRNILTNTTWIDPEFTPVKITQYRRGIK